MAAFYKRFSHFFLFFHNESGSAEHACVVAEFCYDDGTLRSVNRAEYLFVHDFLHGFYEIVALRAYSAAEHYRVRTENIRDVRYTACEFFDIIIDYLAGVFIRIFIVERRLAANLFDIADFDYAFNLTYGSGYFRDDDLLRDLRRLLDDETRRHIVP